MNAPFDKFPSGPVEQGLVDAACRRYFGMFWRKCFRELNPGTQFKDNWHLDAIAHQLEELRAGRCLRTIINVPPRSLKSQLTSVAWVAFLLGHDPSVRIICVSHSQELALKFSREFRKVIESTWYCRIFPGTQLSKCTESEIETSRGGGRLATSVAGSITGFGGAIIIIDDPMTPVEAASEAARVKVINYYRNVLFSRLDDKATGKIVLVMQRLHDDDLSGYLLREWKESCTHLNLPAKAIHHEVIETAAGQFHYRQPNDLLHPERENQAVLDELRRQLGSASYEAQYQQSPVPDDGNMVKLEWFKRFVGELDLTDGTVYQCWDTALKGDPQHDFSVGLTILHRRGHNYLIDVVRRQMEFPDLLRAARTAYDQYCPAAVLVEDQGSGAILIGNLLSQGIAAIRCRSKYDKETRLATVTHMIEAGQVSLPQDAPWLADFLRELMGFPNTKHDDQADALSQYLGWIRDREKPRFDVYW